MLAFMFDAFSGRAALFMWAITAILAFGIAIFAERAWTFLVSWQVDEKAIRVAAEGGDWKGALGLAGRSPLAEVLRRGMGLVSPEAAWDAMSAAAIDAETAYQARIGYLSTIGNISTMVGLLGNVMGVIVAFGSLGSAAVDERAVHLSEGVATAMATTAYGLMVAIPALAAHAWLEAQARRRLAFLESIAAILCARLREDREPGRN
jgi:biopolymer transport protein ExbB/TolQ